MSLPFRECSTMAPVCPFWAFLFAFGTCFGKNLAPYRIGKRPHNQNRAKIHQKYRKSYFLSIFDVFLGYFEGCCVFLSCRGSSLSQNMLYRNQMSSIDNTVAGTERNRFWGSQRTNCEFGLGGSPTFGPPEQSCHGKFRKIGNSWAGTFL